MEKKPKVSAAIRVRKAFQDSQDSLSLSKIQASTGLKDTEVSMSLCYLLKRNEITRELVANPSGKGRKQVWLYTKKENVNV